MTGIGLFPGDIAIVNRALQATHGAIIIALVDGAFTIKRYDKRGVHVQLQAENPHYSPIVIRDDMDFEVWGVVTSAIRMLHPTMKR